MPTETDESIEATPLCPGCMRPVEGDPDFCPFCNAPLGMISLIDPKREAQSYGFLYSHCAGLPNTPLIFWGMIVIFGSFLLTGLALMGRWPVHTASSKWDSIGDIIIGAFFATIGAIVLCRTILNRERIHLTPKSENEDGIDASRANKD